MRIFTWSIIALFAALVTGLALAAAFTVVNPGAKKYQVPAAVACDPIWASNCQQAVNAWNAALGGTALSYLGTDFANADIVVLSSGRWAERECGLFGGALEVTCDQLIVLSPNAPLIILEHGIGHTLGLLDVDPGQDCAAYQGIMVATPFCAPTWPPNAQELQGAAQVLIGWPPATPTPTPCITRGC